MASPEDIETLAGGWLSLPELAAAIGETQSTLRQWVREGRLVTLPRGARSVQSVPADLVRSGSLVRGLASTLTVLADAGFAPIEALAWLLRFDEPLGGRPVDLMAEGRDVAVRRRAIMLAL